MKDVAQLHQEGGFLSQDLLPGRPVVQQGGQALEAAQDLVPGQVGPGVGQGLHAHSQQKVEPVPVLASALAGGWRLLCCEGTVTFDFGGLL